MRIDFDTLSPNQAYHLMTQTIIPRPVAWVLTANETSGYNLAPFSFFNAICSNPPLVMFSAGKKPDGTLKDTRHNLGQSKQLVIHVPSVDQAEEVTETARTLDYGDSELYKIRHPLVNEPDWDLPRLENAPVAMLAELTDLHEVGPNQQAIFYCEIKALYVRDDLVEEDAKGRTRIDAAKMQPLARLGGGEYATFGEVFKLDRPA